MRIDVSIIIISYNTKSLTTKCIESIFKYTNDINYEVIVVDNASSDGTCTQIRELYPTVVLIESKENLGFGKANNLGMQTARGRYFFLLNSDTLLKNNAIRFFYDYCEGTPDKIGAVGCILKSLEGRNIHSYGPFLTTRHMVKQYFNRLFLHRKNMYLYPSDVSTSIDVDYVTGADMFLPRCIFELTGGFSPEFFMYCEESDWQKRMENLGYKRQIINGPYIIHLEGGSDPSVSHQWSYRRTRELEKSTIVYMKRNSSFLPYLWFRIINCLIKMPIFFFIRKDTLKNKITLVKLLFD